MERILAKYQQLYTRSECHMDTWKELKKQFCKELSAASSVIGRLPLLADDSLYGIFADVEGFKEKLQGRQLDSLEVIMKAMGETLESMEREWKRMEKAWQDGWKLVQGERSMPTAVEASTRVGPRASIVDCLEGLQDLYVMHRDEHALKVEIAKAVRYDMAEEDLNALMILAADEPHIDPSHVKVIFDRFSSSFQ
ncbi:hypothetical protein CBR_g30123 [Chara braunii]|uniref:Uncharacterized protein n=1 Tax=Chara braunii TaxID=69332 RepID=A0A388LC29_CHABU|nr:hypothetical protein CBR_g30123 [Chara braunii]|eukprot:GBG79858.1 hypothetical protein CBR_g30123 [Chara braunii]